MMGMPTSAEATIRRRFIAVLQSGLIALLGDVNLLLSLGVSFCGAHDLACAAVGTELRIVRPEFATSCTTFGCSHGLGNPCRSCIQGGCIRYRPLNSLDWGRRRRSALDASPREIREPSVWVAD